MITWSIRGGGGTIASGIPSEDVGLALLRDMVLDPEESEDEGTHRLEVRRELGEDTDSDDLFWVAVDRWGHQQLCLSSEERCDHCGQVRDYFHGFLGNP